MVLEGNSLNEIYNTGLSPFDDYQISMLSSLYRFENTPVARYRYIIKISKLLLIPSVQSVSTHSSELSSVRYVVNKARE